MFITTIENTQKAARGFRTIFSVIGVLIVLGGIFLGLVSSGGFLFGRFRFDNIDPITFGLYVFGSLLSGLIFVNIGRAVYHAMDCLCMIAHNTGKR